MQPKKRLSCSCSSRTIGIAALVGAVAAASAPTAAQAQELTHRFINPSFGGNPFYSDHLLGIANIHRPDEPEEPAAPAPTEEELLARQLQARFLSQLSTSIRDQIENAQPGQSGAFDFGNQRISFTRSQTETRVTFVNTATGETRVIVIPVPGSGSSALAASAGTARAPVSAEQALGAGGAALSTPSNNGLAPPPL
jgi:curli production assembly/transport component CsgF